MVRPALPDFLDVRVIPRSSQNTYNVSNNTKQHTKKDFNICSFPDGALMTEINFTITKYDRLLNDAPLVLGIVSA